MAARIPRPIAAAFSWMPEFIRSIERAIDQASGSSAGRIALGLAADEVSTITSDAIITDANGNWTFSMEAGQKYRVQVIGAFTTAASTTGAKMVVDIDLGAGTIRGSFRASIDNTAGTANEYVQPISVTTGQAILTPGAANGAQSIHLDAILTCTTSGDVNIWWATEVAGSAATLLAGSTLIVEEL